MRTAAEAMTHALVQLATENRRPRCGDPVTRDLWTSEKREEREQAASWCVGCPVLHQCHDAAEETGETFGVWGGIDRGDKGGGPQRSHDLPAKRLSGSHGFPQSSRGNVSEPPEAHTPLSERPRGLASVTRKRSAKRKRGAR